MQVVDAIISRPVDACWRVFTDTSKLASWVPGLRTAKALSTRRDGLPAEIRFQFLAGPAYALRYTYDLDAHTIHWEPIGAGGVRGSARFEATDNGTRLTYSLEQDMTRRAGERALDDPHNLAEAFASWMHEHEPVDIDV